MLPRPYLSHPVAAVESGERAACIRLHETCVTNHLDGEARRQPAFDLPFGDEDPSLFRRVYVRGSRVSTRFVCPRIKGPPKAFKAWVVVRPHFCLWLQADSGWAENYFCFTPKSRPSWWCRRRSVPDPKETLALPQNFEHWSLTMPREKLIKIGAKAVRHGRYVTFQLAEVAIPRALFAEILRLISDLRPVALPPP